jgi:hypothetical protein
MLQIGQPIPVTGLKPIYLISRPLQSRATTKVCSDFLSATTAKWHPVAWLKVKTAISFCPVGNLFLNEYSERILRIRKKWKWSAALQPLNKVWKINHLKDRIQMIQKKSAQFGNIKPY